VHKSLDYGYLVSKSDETEELISDEQNEELTNEPTLFIDMPNAIKQMRVRDRSTGRFVPGSAAMLASQFKKHVDA
jgi:hypothetical protein